MSNSLPCTLNTPSPIVPYCRPTPYQSTGDEKYFLVKEAYGASAQANTEKFSADFEYFDAPYKKGNTYNILKPAGKK